MPGDELSKTTLQDAWELGLDRDDPEVVALAKKAQDRKREEEKRKKSKLSYKIKTRIEDAAPGIVLAIITFLGVTVGGVITAIVKGL